MIPKFRLEDAFVQDHLMEDPATLRTVKINHSKKQGSRCDTPDSAYCGCDVPESKPYQEDIPVYAFSSFAA